MANRPSKSSTSLSKPSKDSMSGSKGDTNLGGKQIQQQQGQQYTFDKSHWNYDHSEQLKYQDSMYKMHPHQEQHLNQYFDQDKPVKLVKQQNQYDDYSNTNNVNNQYQNQNMINNNANKDNFHFDFNDNNESGEHERASAAEASYPGLEEEGYIEEPEQYYETPQPVTQASKGYNKGQKQHQQYAPVAVQHPSMVMNQNQMQKSSHSKGPSGPGPNPGKNHVVQGKPVQQPSYSKSQTQYQMHQQPLTQTTHKGSSSLSSTYAIQVQQQHQQRQYDQYDNDSNGYQQQPYYGSYDEVEGRASAAEASAPNDYYGQEEGEYYENNGQYYENDGNNHGYTSRASAAMAEIGDDGMYQMPGGESYQEGGGYTEGGEYNYDQSYETQGGDMSYAQAPGYPEEESGETYGTSGSGKGSGKTQGPKSNNSNNSNNSNSSQQNQNLNVMGWDADAIYDDNADDATDAIDGARYELKTNNKGQQYWDMDESSKNHRMQDMLAQGGAGNFQEVNRQVRVDTVEDRGRRADGEQYEWDDKQKLWIVKGNQHRGDEKNMAKIFTGDDMQATVDSKVDAFGANTDGQVYKWDEQKHIWIVTEGDGKGRGDEKKRGMIWGQDMQNTLDEQVDTLDKKATAAGFFRHNEKTGNWEWVDGSGQSGSEHSGAKVATHNIEVGEALRGELTQQNKLKHVSAGIIGADGKVNKKFEEQQMKNIDASVFKHDEKTGGWQCKSHAPIVNIHGAATRGMPKVKSFAAPQPKTSGSGGGGKKNINKGKGD